jgi:hypothetical protein
MKMMRWLQIERLLTWEGYTAAVIPGNVFVLQVNILRRYMQLLQMLAWVIFVLVEELGSVEDIELVKSRGTRSRMRVGEGRLAKSLLTECFRHYSPSATCVPRNRVLFLVLVLRFRFEVSSKVRG